MTRYLLGVDVGTSSTKALLLADDGRAVAQAGQEYTIDTPRPGWAEQDPEVWWGATVATVRSVLEQSGVAAAAVAALSFSGQMHGTVLLDAADRPLRPAIIWCDQRSAPQAQRIYSLVGLDGLARLTSNRVAAGFMAATLLWLKEHEPETYARARRVLLPKDYVRLRMTGEAATEVSDASSSLLLDVRHRAWSDQFVSLLGLASDKLPPLHESTAVVGGLTTEAAAALGLAAGMPVVAGGGDQEVAALGNGVVEPGQLLVTIGTGGQLLTVVDEPLTDAGLRVHTFCHVVPGRWHLQASILAAGLSLRWFRDQVMAGTDLASYERLSAEAATVPVGSEGLLFLPYLIGERTPHFDPAARGTFCGLTLRHDRGHMVRAIMEGVTFALRDGLEIFRALGVRAEQTIASGGGASSPLWRQIMADVFNTDLVTTQVSEQAAFGAALLAGVGVGVYSSFFEARQRSIQFCNRTVPDPRNVERYARLFEIYRSLYPSLCAQFARLSELE